MPYHVLRPRLIQRVLASSSLRWRVPRAALSTNATPGLEHVEEDENVNKLYAKQQKYLHEKADEALLFTIQNNKQWLELLSQAQDLVSEAPLEELQDAGIDVTSVQHSMDRLQNGMLKQEASHHQSNDHALDLFHADYPTLSPDPFKAYREYWSARTSAERAIGLEELEADILEREKDLKSRHNKLFSLLVDTYGSNAVQQVMTDIANNNLEDMWDEAEEEEEDPIVDEMQGQVDAEVTVGPFGVKTIRTKLTTNDPATESSTADAAVDSTKHDADDVNRTLLKPTVSPEKNLSLKQQLAKLRKAHLA